MTGGPIDAFLADLGRLLRRDDEERRRVLTEVGDHLRDLAADARARGLGEQDAELDAVDRFGSPRDLARGLRPGRRVGAPVKILGAITAAGCLAALVLTFTHRDSPRPPLAPPLKAHATGVAARTSALPHWCTDVIQAINSHSSGQIMIAIDPSTGRAVSWGRGTGYLMTPVCHLSPIDGPGRSTWIAADPAAPFG